MKQRGFRFLWTGQSVANLGDVLYIVGLMSYLYRFTGSAVLMAFVPFFSTASRFLSALVAPVFLEWMGLKRSLVVSQVGKTVLLLVFFLLHFFSLDGERLETVFTTVILVSFFDGWATPARGALVPLLVTREKLIATNSFLSLMDQSISMGSWALGGIIAARFGNNLLIALSLILCGAAALLMMLICVTEVRNRKQQAQSKQSKWTVMKKGWITIWRVPALRTIFITESINALADVVWIAAIIYVFVAQALHVDASWWGYINFSFFAGLLLTSCYGMRWGTRLKKHASSTAVWGLLLACMITLFFAMNSMPWAALVLSILYGAAVQFKSIIFLTVEQNSVCAEQLANVFAAQDAVQSILFGIGSLIFGTLADLFGIRSVFFLSALLLFLAFFLLLVYRKQIVIKKQVSD
ncbi:MFS transporter [Sporolactobacillus shoreicorticis]|uniref:MFS transporter n=1 Tax=Sporolactobacillus shoreicorticis TaxID=1923877 RepID=A0ABW5S7L4_9BACL|nr:MFS transporter [Sporolactobacillus shoreicorticis]MCO7128230.1 MFS transporter [Sporolactobacillus shoreicorticis]